MAPTEARVYPIDPHRDAHEPPGARSAALVALLVLLVAAAIFRIPTLGLESLWADESYYAWNAEQTRDNPTHVVTHEVVQTSTHLYALVAAPLTAVLQNVAAVRWTTMLLSLAGIIAMFAFTGAATASRLSAVLGAALLATHPYYFFLSTRGLTDVPLVALFICSAYLVLNAEDRDSERLWIAAGVCTGLCLYVRGPGILFGVIVAIYLLVRHGISLVRPLARGHRALAAGYVAAILPYFLINLIGYGTPLVTIAENFQHTANYTYYLGVAPNYITLYLAPFALIGAIHGFWRRDRAALLAVIWIAFYVAFFSLFIRAYIARYMLPIAPAAILLALLGMNVVASYIFARTPRLRVGIPIGWFVALAVLFQLQGVRVVQDRARTFTGLVDVAQWIGAHVAEGDALFAQSRRAVRAFAGFPYVEDGGSVQQLPESRAELEAALPRDRNVFIQIDVWERRAPGYVSPLTRDSLRYFLELGFQPVRIVERRVPSPTGMTESGVAFVLHRPPSR